MTRVDFYINVEARERTACTIAAKAIERGVRLFVLTADEAQSERVDRLMWTFAQLSFLPHVRAAHPLAARTPVIVDHCCDPLPHDQVLLNLTETPPAVFSRFERLVEIVSLDADDRQREPRDGAQRALEQAELDFARQQFEEARDYPMRGIEVLRASLGLSPQVLGIGSTTTETRTEPGADLISRLAGTALGAGLGGPIGGALSSLGTLGLSFLRGGTGGGPGTFQPLPQTGGISQNPYGF
jgi:DNA polymerase-3 subunit chi